MDHELFKYASFNNQPFQVRPTGINVNANEPLYYSLVVCVNKCGGSSNIIDDPYAQIFVPNKVKIWM